jgi:hypothetical protein
MAQHPPGDRVVITAGPLRDVEAIFDRTLSPSGRVCVLIRMLERLCRAEVHVSGLQRAISSDEQATLPISRHSDSFAASGSTAADRSVLRTRAGVRITAPSGVIGRRW